MKTETFSAIVTKNEDPEKRGRIKVKSLELLGAEDKELPIWIEPSPLWGWFVVPDIGEEVAIEAELSTKHNEVADQGWLDNPRLWWTGRRYQSKQGEAPRPPDARFTGAGYGKRRGFATPAGHILLFDDTVGQEIVSLADKHGNTVSLTEASIAVADTHDNKIELKDGAITITGASDITCSAGSNVVVEAGASIELKQDPGSPANQVLLGDGADSPAMRFTEWATFFAAHTHTGVTTGPGTSGTPAVPPAGQNIDSKVVQLK